MCMRPKYDSCDRRGRQYSIMSPPTTRTELQAYYIDWPAARQLSMLERASAASRHTNADSENLEGFALMVDADADGTLVIARHLLHGDVCIQRKGPCARFRDPMASHNVDRILRICQHLYTSRSPWPPHLIR